MSTRPAKSAKNGPARQPNPTKEKSSNGNAISGSAESKGLEQLLQLMSQVNAAIKNGDFNTHLANNIFQLCQLLKTHGQQAEVLHKNDLNKVFVSLRQASCQDSGQLGTPCRLKIMEIIELRAMGWRPNMAHSQYYTTKRDSTSNDDKPTVRETPSEPEPTAVSPQKPPMPFPQNNFPNVHVPAFAPPPYAQPVPVFGDGQPVPPSGYFLIPTGGPWPQSMVPAMMPAQYQPPLLRQGPEWMPQSAVAAAVQAHFAKSMRPGMPTPVVGVKSVKQPQLREEITIRNSDSGKIMGVKGRRVAVVEELSKTVISFQKVDHNSKFRLLSISGSTPESLQYAKHLIEETIRRNVSPNRLDEPSAAEHEEERAAEEEPEISIETGVDGSLKVSCADPDMLEAAQAALKEYINLRTGRLSAKEREERKERRKSMPIQTSTSTRIPTTAEPSEQKSAEEGSCLLPEASLKAHGSTPNLMAESVKAEAAPQPPTPQKYDRNKMLCIRETVDCTDETGHLAQRAREINVEWQRHETTETAKKSEPTSDDVSANASSDAQQ